MMKKILSYMLFVALPVLPANATVVQVKLSQETLNFSTQPRVSVLLQILKEKPSIYWPTAKLYQIDTAIQSELLQNQQLIVASLRQLIIFWHHDQQVSQQLSALRREIASWQLGVLVNTPLDLDLTMLRQDANPVLNPGTYVLSVSKRLNYVSLLAIGGRSDVMYQQGKPAHEYLQEANYSDSVKLVDEVVYFPNQTFDNVFDVKTIPVAPWNKTAEPVANGTLMFVPIAADILTEQYATLNEQIIQLAQHRIAP